MPKTDWMRNDPIGVVPLFVSLTPGMDAAHGAAVLEIVVGRRS